MATNINTGVIDDSFSLSHNRLRRPNDNKRGIALFSNIQLEFRLQPGICIDIQRSTNINKECFTWRFWSNKQMQSDIWGEYKRDRDRELPIQLDYWRYFKINNKGGQ